MTEKQLTIYTWAVLLGGFALAVTVAARSKKNG